MVAQRQKLTGAPPLFICWNAATRLHDLILSQTAGVLSTFHSIAVALVGILDVVQTERPAAVLVAGELGY